MPAALLMAAIFVFSSIPSQEMPSFGFWDTLVKKSGHAIGYGILALLFWYALRWERKHAWMVFLFVIAYGLLDEFHQSFVPGRHPSILDALIFDAGGGLLAIIIARWVLMKRERSNSFELDL